MCAVVPKAKQSPSRPNQSAPLGAFCSAAPSTQSTITAAGYHSAQLVHRTRRATVSSAAQARLVRLLGSDHASWGHLRPVPLLLWTDCPSIRRRMEFEIGRMNVPHISEFAAARHSTFDTQHSTVKTQKSQRSLMICGPRTRSYSTPESSLESLLQLPKHRPPIHKERPRPNHCHCHCHCIWRRASEPSTVSGRLRLTQAEPRTPQAPETCTEKPEVHQGTSRSVECTLELVWISASALA